MKRPVHFLWKLLNNKYIDRGISCLMLYEGQNMLNSNEWFIWLILLCTKWATAFTTRDKSLVLYFEDWVCWGGPHSFVIFNIAILELCRTLRHTATPTVQLHCAHVYYFSLENVKRQAKKKSVVGDNVAHLVQRAFLQTFLSNNHS